MAFFSLIVFDFTTSESLVVRLMHVFAHVSEEPLQDEDDEDELSDEDSDSEDDDKKEAVMHSVTISHYGGINRVKVSLNCC